MDKRLLAVLACPVCRHDLEFSGEANGRRLLSGEFCCAGCGLVFPIKREVPVLVAPDANRDSTFRAEQAAYVGEWIERKFFQWQQENLTPLIRAFVETAQSYRGPILDIASGLGGSFCVPIMQDGNTDRLLVMSDLGIPVMPAWRHCLREAGWGDRCSTVTLDARRLPFRDASMQAITSVAGFDNVADNREAYQEAARVLQVGGQLLDMARFYEDEGPTHRLLTEGGQAAASWKNYRTLLARLDFVVERRDVLNSGRGKSEPEDGLPLGDEAWEQVMVFATRR
ncbi:MAG TPA: methyltransferase domain-containing protein [Chthonomonadaceae bacterium]|nr:methyltransferase domain-containing protein [Chthonomonadaceae bacterium]